MLQDIKRKFTTVLDLGSGPGHFSKLLDSETTQKVLMLDSSGRSFASILSACLMTWTLHVEKLLNRDPNDEFDGMLQQP